MKKTMIMAVLACSVLTGCVRLNVPPETEVTDTIRFDPPEQTVIRLALNDSGHILNAIAEDKGYLRDEGITVEYVYTETDSAVFEGIREGRIDVASNSGTNLPLQMISEGMDLTIFGGYLLTGCMPVFGRKETEWTDIRSLIGKTMACEPNMYAITGPLLDLRYEPLREVKWYNPDDQMDRITAVLNGEADYGLVGTALNYEVLNNPDLKIMTYADDILPEYSCCRVEALTSWVQENPNTVKALLRAWIRAMSYYEANHEDAVNIAVKVIDQDEKVIRAYLDNPRFNLNTGPMKKSIKRAWRYMRRLGILSRESARINIDNHINVDLYKEALDECQKKYGSENPRFYEKMQAQFAKNNQ
ncbi:MAG: ABC transporter substrate-binding protein [Solobacterium sp.]|nr:ABC transporter substrate-binding protein [Solobacterium sp.]